MSSTWFKNVRALKTDMISNGFKETGYILIADTAESNVYNNNGGHCYHEWIIAEGDYYEVMRKVCSISIDFETGMAKWKPNKKDATGFIRMCKKALENAKYEEKIPAYLNGYVFWGDTQYNEIVNMFKDKIHIEKKMEWGKEILTCNNIETYIKAKNTINSIIESYKNSLIDKCSIPFNEWIEKNQHLYSIQNVKKFENKEA